LLFISLLPKKHSIFLPVFVIPAQAGIHLKYFSSLSFSPATCGQGEVIPSFVGWCSFVAHAEIKVSMGKLLSILPTVTDYASYALCHAYFATLPAGRQGCKASISLFPLFKPFQPFKPFPLSCLPACPDVSLQCHVVNMQIAVFNLKIAF
jgi:hypothetical protein